MKPGSKGYTVMLRPPLQRPLHPCSPAPEKLAYSVLGTSPMARDVAHLMHPAQEGFFEAIPVSDRVNKVANMGPELQDPVAVAAAPVPNKQKPGNAGQLDLF